MNQVLANLQKKFGVTADGFWGPGTMKAAVAYYKLSPLRGAHFFAQAAHECGNFTTLSENLNYTAEGLTKTWPKLFPADIAAQYAKQPERIANRAYGLRIGNGSEETGDGWKYRGRGCIQLTGRENYILFADYIGKHEIIDNPDLVTTDYVIESGMYFFNSRKLWDLCDKGIGEDIITQITKKINGGTLGLKERIEKTHQYAQILGV